MEKQILVFEDIVHGGYAVMVCWATGNRFTDIKTYESISHYDTIDDVRKMAEALNSILERWGNNEQSDNQ